MCFTTPYIPDNCWINIYSLKNNRVSYRLILLCLQNVQIIGVDHHAQFLCLFTLCMHAFIYYQSSCCLAQAGLKLTIQLPILSSSGIIALCHHTCVDVQIFKVIYLVRWQITNRSFLGRCICCYKESTLTIVEIKTQFFLNY